MRRRSCSQDDDSSGSDCCCCYSRLALISDAWSYSSCGHFFSYSSGHLRAQAGSSGLVWALPPSSFGDWMRAPMIMLFSLDVPPLVVWPFYYCMLMIWWLLVRTQRPLLLWRATCSVSFRWGRSFTTLRYFLGLEVAFSPRGYCLSQQKYTIFSVVPLSVTLALLILRLYLQLRPTDGELLPDPTRYRQRRFGVLDYLSARYRSCRPCGYLSVPFTMLPCFGFFAICVGLWLALSYSLPHLSCSFVRWCRLGWRSHWSSFYYWLLCFPGLLYHGKARSRRLSLAPVLRLSIVRCPRLLRRLFGFVDSYQIDLGLVSSSPTPLYCENLSTIQIASNPVFPERTKHIEIDCNFVRQFYPDVLSLPTFNLPSNDLFTKTHTMARFQYLLGRGWPTVSFWGGVLDIYV